MGRYTYQIGGGDIMKWTREGQEVDGRYAGVREGKQFAGNAEPSMLVMIDLEDGSKRRVALPANVVLLGKLAQIRIGAGVTITYLGKRMGKRGTEYGDFGVAAESPDDVLAGRQATKKKEQAPVQRDTDEPW